MRFFYLCGKFEYLGFGEIILSEDNFQGWIEYNKEDIGDNELE